MISSKIGKIIQDNLIMKGPNLECWSIFKEKNTILIKITTHTLKHKLTLIIEIQLNYHLAMSKTKNRKMNRNL